MFALAMQVTRTTIAFMLLSPPLPLPLPLLLLLNNDDDEDGDEGGAAGC